LSLWGIPKVFFGNCQKLGIAAGCVVHDGKLHSLFCGVMVLPEMFLE
jgi:hypothetical protein